MCNWYFWALGKPDSAMQKHQEAEEIFILLSGMIGYFHPSIGAS